MRLDVSDPDELTTFARDLVADRGVVRYRSSGARAWNPKPLLETCNTKFVALILDAGPLYASLDRSDADHLACRERIEHANEPLVIPAPVLVGVDDRIHARMHAGVLTALLDDVASGAYLVDGLASDEYARVREVCDSYADADVGFVDALRLVPDQVDEADGRCCLGRSAPRPSRRHSGGSSSSSSRTRYTSANATASSTPDATAARPNCSDCTRS